MEYIEGCNGSTRQELYFLRDAFNNAGYPCELNVECDPYKGRLDVESLKMSFDVNVVLNDVWWRTRESTLRICFQDGQELDQFPFGSRFRLGEVNEQLADFVREGDARAIAFNITRDSLQRKFS